MDTLPVYVNKLNTPARVQAMVGMHLSDASTRMDGPWMRAFNTYKCGAFPRDPHVLKHNQAQSPTHQPSNMHAAIAHRASALQAPNGLFFLPAAFFLAQQA